MKAKSAVKRMKKVVKGVAWKSCFWFQHTYEHFKLAHYSHEPKFNLLTTRH